MKKTNTKSKQEDIFNNEFIPYADVLYNFAVSLSDKETAHDLVQETYLKAYKFIDSFTSGTNAKAWLFRILKNTFINYYRKKTKEDNRISFGEINDFQYYNHSKDLIVKNLTIENIDESLNHEVMTALKNLDIDYQIPIILFNLQGFRYKEIADILQIPVGTVRSRLHRGRNILKNQLLEYGKKMGYMKKKTHRK